MRALQFRDGACEQRILRLVERARQRPLLGGGLADPDVDTHHGRMAHYETPRLTVPAPADLARTAAKLPLDELPRLRKRYALEEKGGGGPNQELKQLVDCKSSGANSEDLRL